MFEDTIQKVLAVYDEDAFRRSGKEGGKENSINRALMDILLLSSSQHPVEDLLTNKEAINQQLANLIKTDEEFSNSLKIGTSDTKVINIRLSRWCTAVDNICNR